MKYLFSTYLYIICSIVLFSSCKQNEACIDGPTDVIVGETVTYTFCGESKDNTWYVYDGLNNYTYENQESITVEFGMATEYARVSVDASGGILKGDDQEDIDVKVSNGGYKLKIRDSQYSQGFTSIEGVVGATVNLYTSKTCFEDESTTETCLIASATADNDGIATFPDIEAGTYVADIRGYDVHSNWSSNVRDMEVTFEETDLYSDYYPEVLVDYNGFYLIVQPSKWKISNITADGTSLWASVSDCAKDNYLMFNRDLTWEYKEGENICTESGASSGIYEAPSIYNNYPINEQVYFTASLISGSFEFSNMYLTDNNTLQTDYYFTDPGTGNQSYLVYTFTRQE